MTTVYIDFNDGKGYVTREALIGEFMLPGREKKTICKVVSLCGNQWDRECDVYYDPYTDEMYRCRYSVGKPPIESLSFHMEVTGEFKWKDGYYVATCRIVVPHPENSPFEVETFCGKVRIQEI